MYPPLNYHLARTGVAVLLLLGGCLAGPPGEEDSRGPSTTPAPKEERVSDATAGRLLRGSGCDVIQLLLDTTSNRADPEMPPGFSREQPFDTLPRIAIEHIGCERFVITNVTEISDAAVLRISIPASPPTDERLPPEMVGSVLVAQAASNVDLAQLFEIEGFPTPIAKYRLEQSAVTAIVDKYVGTIESDAEFGSWRFEAFYDPDRLPGTGSFRYYQLADGGLVHYDNWYEGQVNLRSYQATLAAGPDSVLARLMPAGTDGSAWGNVYNDATVVFQM